MFFDKWYFHEGAVVVVSLLIINPKLKFMEMVNTVNLHLFVSASLTLLVKCITLISAPGHFGGGLDLLP